MSGDVASVTPSIGGQSFNDALMAVTRHSSRILIPASSFESPCLAQILNAHVDEESISIRDDTIFNRQLFDMTLDMDVARRDIINKYTTDSRNLIAPAYVLVSQLRQHIGKLEVDRMADQSKIVQTYNSFLYKYCSPTLIERIKEQLDKGAISNTIEGIWSFVLCESFASILSNENSQRHINDILKAEIEMMHTSLDKFRQSNTHRSSMNVLLRLKKVIITIEENVKVFQRIRNGSMNNISAHYLPTVLQWSSLANHLNTYVGIFSSDSHRPYISALKAILANTSLTPHQQWMNFRDYIFSAIEANAGDTTDATTAAISFFTVTEYDPVAFMAVVKAVRKKNPTLKEKSHQNELYNKIKEHFKQKTYQFGIPKKFCCWCGTSDVTPFECKCGGK